jgi:hypothetical protein
MADQESEASSPATKVHRSYQHEAFFYRSPEEFLAGTVPFVQDALDLEQPIMVALIKPQLQALREAVGDCGDGVAYVDMEELGANPARIIPGWQAFIEDHAQSERPIRGIGEPQWPGRRPEEVIECQLHEALLNVAVDPDTPLWLRCPYDLAALSEPLIQASMKSHPALVEDGGYRGSPQYQGLHHVTSLFESPLPVSPLDCTVLALEAVSPELVRRQVARSAGQSRLDQERSQALVEAVALIVTDSLRRGQRGGELRIWLRPDAVVCEIRHDSGFEDPMVGRRGRRPEQEKGAALWPANQLSDLIQVRSTPQGGVVRVFAWIDPPESGLTSS